MDKSDGVYELTITGGIVNPSGLPSNYDLTVTVGDAEFELTVAFIDPAASSVEVVSATFVEGLSTEVEVEATVKDGSGDPITGLTEENLWARVELDGAETGRELFWQGLLASATEPTAVLQFLDAEGIASDTQVTVADTVTLTEEPDGVYRAVIGGGIVNPSGIPSNYDLSVSLGNQRYDLRVAYTPRGSLTVTSGGADLDGRSVVQGQSVDLGFDVSDVALGTEDGLFIVFDGSGPGGIGPAGEDVATALLGEADLLSLLASIGTSNGITSSSTITVDGLSVEADAPVGAWVLNFYLVSSPDHPFTGAVVDAYTATITVQEPGGSLAVTSGGQPLDGREVAQGAGVDLSFEVSDVVSGSTLFIVFDGSGPGDIGPAGEDVATALLGEADLLSLLASIGTSNGITSSSTITVDGLSVEAEAPVGAWVLNFYLVSSDTPPFTGAVVDTYTATITVTAPPVLPPPVIPPQPTPPPSDDDEDEGPSDPPPPPSAPTPPPSGGSSGAVDGQPIEVETTVTPEGGATLGGNVNGDGFELTVDADRSDNGDDPTSPPPPPPSEDDPVARGAPVFQRGAPLTLRGSGFAPNSNVQAWLLSDPTLVGVFETDAGGSLDAASEGLLDGLSACPHTLVLVGQLPSGSELNLATRVWIDAEGPSFADVAASTWRRAVDCMVDQDVIRGFGDDTFRPNGSLTRQAVAAFVYRMAGSPPVSVTEAPFRDVAVDHPFAAEIVWLTEQEIVRGFDDGTFRPNALITRQAMAAFLYRLAGEPELDAEVEFLPDAGPGHPFATEIAWLADVGVTTAFPDGEFKPSRTLLRGPAAAVLVRSQSVLEAASVTR